MLIYSKSFYNNYAIKPMNNYIYFNENEMLLGNQYLLNYYNLLGKGAFGQVYEGKNAFTGEKVAIKIESKNKKDSFLYNEYCLYKNLQGGIGIPKIYHYENNAYFNSLVMEKLGPSLEDLFKLCNKKFSIETTIKLGINILSRLEFIHDRNIIHRDIKPDCFLFGENLKSSTIYLIDFGLAKFYRNPISKNHIPYEKNQTLIENIMYASLNSLKGITKSRRDDIESLGYMLVYFLKGSLPWHRQNRGYYYGNSKMMRKYAYFLRLYYPMYAYSYKNHGRANSRMSISLETLCKGLPYGIQRFIQYSRNLKFYDRPNYDYLRQLLRSCSKSNLNEYDFDWITKKREEIFNLTFFKTLTNNDFYKISGGYDLNVKKDDRDIIESKYIGNPNSFRINGILRTKGVQGLSKSDLKLYETLNRVIKLQKTTEDYKAYRHVDNNYLINVLYITPSYNLFNTVNQIKKLKGIVKIEKGFMSCAMTDKHILSRNIKLEIKIPKGTYAYITRNIQESEIILANNTRYQIFDAYLDFNNRIHINIGILN